MDLEHLQDIYINNIERVFTPDEFDNIARHSNNVQGYSFINRMLIYMQNKYSTQVRSSESWISEGYIVKPDSTPLGIISPILETKYFSTDTNDEIGIKELSTTEFAKAVRLGVVKKEVTLKSIKCTLVYDVTDITKIDSTENDNKPRKLRISSLYELLISIGINIEKVNTNKSSYDSCKNTIIIGEDSLLDRLVCCISALVKFIVGISSVDIQSDVEKLVNDYTTHAILTYYNIESNIHFEYIKDIYNKYKNIDNGVENIIDILDTVENVLNTQVFKGSYNSDYDEDYINHIMSRAATLLGILEANYESFRFKGA